MKKFFAGIIIVFVLAAIMSGCVTVDLYKVLTTNGEAIIAGSPVEIRVTGYKGIEKFETVAGATKSGSTYTLVPDSGLIFAVADLKTFKGPIAPAKQIRGFCRITI